MVLFLSVIMYVPGLYLRKAWCEFHMGDMYESIADTGKVLKIEGKEMCQSPRIHDLAECTFR